MTRNQFLECWQYLDCRHPRTHQTQDQHLRLSWPGLVEKIALRRLGENGKNDYVQLADHRPRIFTPSRGVDARRSERLSLVINSKSVVGFMRRRIERLRPPGAGEGAGAGGGARGNNLGQLGHWKP